MKTKISRIGKSSLSVILSLMMIISTMLVGTISTNAYATDEYGQQYLYVDLSAKSGESLEGVNYYWDTSCSNYGGWINSGFEKLDNNCYKFDLSKANSSYNYFRGFKVVYGSSSPTIGVSNAPNYNCIKVSSSGALSWTNYNPVSVEKYYVVGSAVNNDTTWSTFTELPGSNGTYTKSFANATELASGKDFIVTSAKSTSSNVKPTVSNGTGISFTGGGNSDIQFSFSSNYTYPVTLTLKKSGSNYTLTGTATSNVKPVATSVSLAASPSPVETNSPITLTAALSGKASGLGDVTYTFTKTSGGNGTFSNATQTTSATTATATFTPSGTGSYTFKVVASATGYTSVENTVTVNVTAPAVYYVQGRFHVKSSATATNYTNTFTSGDWAEDSKNIKFTKVAEDEYELNTYCTLKELSENTLRL